MNDIDKKTSYYYIIALLVWLVYSRPIQSENDDVFWKLATLS